jgi:regulator of protease activity HflC (stomatin/prohibitin superfamily)
MNVASIVQLLAGVSWMVVLGAIVFGGVLVARGGKARGIVPVVVGAIILAVVLNVTAAGLVFIEPQQRGVVISALQPQGYRLQALSPGLQWVVPFFENVRTYSISRDTYTMSRVASEGELQGDDSIEARTKDGQQVNIDASVIFAIDPAKVVELHIIWQDNYEIGVIRPVSRSVIRDVASQYGVEEIVTSKRADFQAAVIEQITRRLAENNLILVDFLLRDIKFTEQYAQAVEQKQIAEQLAQQAEFVVEQKRQEAEQARQVAQGQADAAVIASKGAAEARLIQAEAEAKSLALIADALKDNPDLIQYTYVQKLGGNVQVMLVPSNSPYLFNLPEVPAATAPATSVPTTEPGTTP